MMKGSHGRMPLHIAASGITRLGVSRHATPHSHRLRAMPSAAAELSVLSKKFTTRARARDWLTSAPSERLAGEVRCLQVLLEATADPNVEDDLRDRPMHYAAMCGRADVLLELLRASAPSHLWLST
eukprot:5577819-Amphidinium_carterae.1